MKPEIFALWKLIDLLRLVVIELLGGLKKPAAADTNKFPLEARNLFRELAPLIHGTFNLSHPASFDQTSAEYQQVVGGLVECLGLDSNTRLMLFQDDRARWLRKFCTDLEILANGSLNHRDGIKRILRICRALEGECHMVCIIPPEKVTPVKVPPETTPDGEERIAYG